jgi:hypothetical protein
MTRTRTETRPIPRRRARTGGLLAAAAAGIAALALASSSLSPGTFVERVSVVNPTPYNLNVELTAPGQRGSLDLGTAARESTMDAQQVFDAGARWVVRFSYAGTPAGEVDVLRRDLEAGGWQVEVPSTVADRLRADGFAPSAR